MQVLLILNGPAYGDANIFEIAEPGADFQRYSHNPFTRAWRTDHPARVARSK